MVRDEARQVLIDTRSDAQRLDVQTHGGSASSYGPRGQRGDFVSPSFDQASRGGESDRARRGCPESRCARETIASDFARVVVFTATCNGVC